MYIETGYIDESYQRMFQELGDSVFSSRRKPHENSMQREIRRRLRVHNDLILLLIHRRRFVPHMPPKHFLRRHPWHRRRRRRYRRLPKVEPSRIATGVGEVEYRPVLGVLGLCAGGMAFLGVISRARRCRASKGGWAGDGLGVIISAKRGSGAIERVLQDRITLLVVVDGGDWWRFLILLLLTTTALERIP